MKLNKLALLLPVVFLVFGCGGSSNNKTLVSIAVTPANSFVAQGTTLQFIATGTFSDNTTQNLTAMVTWTSSNTGVATVSTTGLATSAATGATTITAASGSISGSATLTVSAATLVSIAVTPANPIIAVGATEQFTATGTFSDGTTQNLTTSATWSSSATSVATISNAADSNGKAAAVGSGTTTITATFGSISGSDTLTVQSSGSTESNVLPITVNGSLCSSGSYPNKPCVSVTVCTPGTSTCQTISDILLDTGSYGLRVFKQVLAVPLTQLTVTSGNLAECVQYVDGSADWGPVQTGDVVLGGEPAVTLPIQVIDATFGIVPAACGTPEGSPASAGFNGILGVGLFAEDCGSGCESPNVGNGMYYACSGSSCSGTAVALAKQVQNPVAYLPLDNNGVLVQLPAVSAGGASSVNGELVLGINTRLNNIPSAETAYPADQAGEFISVFNGTTYSGSFIDTGSNGLFFNDSALIVCAAPNSDWYCPSSTQSLSAATEGYTGTPSGRISFSIGNALALFGSSNSAFVELGGPMAGMFDWGLPFFYGRNVFVGIDRKGGSSLGTGPFWAY